jgi:hypothetical protein
MERFFRDDHLVFPGTFFLHCGGGGFRASLQFFSTIPALILNSAIRNLANCLFLNFIFQQKFSGTLQKLLTSHFCKKLKKSLNFRFRF